jgi:hypothetical protein
VADTVRAFKEILDGKHDDVPEANFYMKGGIEEVQSGAPAEKDKTEPPKAQQDKKTAPQTPTPKEQAKPKQ